MIDTHTHLTDKKFEENFDLIINKSISNLTFIINNTSNISDSIKSLNLAQKFNNIWTTFGIHPLDVVCFTKDIEDIFYKYIYNPKIVAIGEIGLDYHYSSYNKELQIDLFDKQCKIAEKSNLPVVIHARDAVKDAISIIEKYKLKGVFHCFSGTIEELSQILNLGFYIGFDGPITYKNNEKNIEILHNTPIDKILCETDSPYLSPTPFRGKLNEPSNVKYIYEKIALLKNINLQELIEQIYNNTITLFSKIKKEI